ncbi:MAG: peroxiredoxin [Cyanobacteria bacterium SID2]|nr:peroxiredoxin [Cyanobacteria bacterium SID2]MBP0006407.1 peroxiredoxin [Cyanobacteria bacterium SBC]
MSRQTLLKTVWATLWASCLALVTGFGVFTQSAFAMGGILPSLNQPAPEFTLPTNTGDGDVSLSDYRGQWVVVYFYPADFTPGCTIEARRFQQDLPKYLDRSTQILGVSADDTISHADFCDSEGLRFPLLSDVDGRVSKAYGSWIYSRSVRHSFIVDPDGILRDRFVKVNPSIHSREVLARLDELQAGNVTL